MFGLTLHDVATAPHPIGIECERCIRRVVVTAAALNARPGDRRTLQEAGLVCSRCGSRVFGITRFLSQAELRAFVQAR